jgi:hypothetical protein
MVSLLGEYERTEGFCVGSERGTLIWIMVTAAVAADTVVTAARLRKEA